MVDAVEGVVEVGGDGVIADLELPPGDHLRYLRIFHAGNERQSRGVGLLLLASDTMPRRSRS